ncbi:MAG: hypothetical protein JXB13_07770 [Phycisphaerae bacterium]|nr:hypothetical protein [Phycisphaerae bacterium]
MSEITWGWKRNVYGVCAVLLAWSVGVLPVMAGSAPRNERRIAGNESAGTINVPAVRPVVRSTVSGNAGDLNAPGGLSSAPAAVDSGEFVTPLAAVPGDLNGDGDVDADDYDVFLAAFGTCQGHAAFVPEADYDGDGCITLSDYQRWLDDFRGFQPPDQAYIENGTLIVNGTQASDLITLRLQAGVPAVLEIDLGDDGTADFSFDRSLFEHISVNAGGGDDVVRIDEGNGVFTDTEITTLNGEADDDTLIGGSGAETFDGGPGHDSADMGAGDDHFHWDPGDGTDLVEGGGGIDTVQVNGSDGDEDFTATANGARVRLDRIDPAPFFLDIGTTENLVLNANGGDDALACTGNLAALIQITVDGGAGDDTLLGGNGADVLIGGADNDFIDGNQGNDTVFLGGGDDVFQWDPGDGSDTVEGQAGHDVVVFNGSNGNEIFAFSANGQRLRFTRNLGNIILDADGIEQFDLQALGGTDTATMNDLTGTAVTQVNVDLSTFGGVGDAQADAVSIAGTPAADLFNISADGDFVVIDLAAEVRVRGYEAIDQVVVNGVGGDTVNVNGSDGPDTMTLIPNGVQGRVDATGFSAAVAVSGALSLVLNGLGGPDSISCTGNLAGLSIPIALDGGADDDTILGSNAGDVLLGGPGNDFIDGNQGNDTAFLGGGDDVFQWDPGDGSDTVEGQAGFDVVAFNGSNGSENFDFSANGQRLRFSRNLGNIILDADDIEQFDLQALGGTDTVTMNDLGGTDVTDVNVDLAGTLGGNSGDAQPDTVIVNATDGDDTILAVGSSGGPVTVLGLATQFIVFHSEVGNDQLRINALAGDDVVDASGLAAGIIGLTVDGGADNDVLIGSDGNDVLLGGDGDDVLLGGPGVDVLDGGLGNNIVIQD